MNNLLTDTLISLDSEVTMGDVVAVNLNSNELKLAYQMAKAAEIGGTSSFRKKSERDRTLSTDQFIGVGLGELAGNKHFFSVKHYYQSRSSKNERPLEGDGGSDTLGYMIDYKASHAKKDDLLSYNLVVRPNERHTGFVYVLVLVKTHGLEPKQLVLGNKPPQVFLIGWASDNMLDGNQRSYGVFGPKNGNGGAFVIPAKKLNKIKDLVVIPSF